MRRDYTVEELLEAYQRNETFRGKIADMEKIQLYHAVKRDLAAFVEQCEDAVSMGGFDPNPREKHAILWVDFSPAAILSQEESAMLAELILETDGLVIAAVDDHIRISFDIKNIWKV